MTADERKDLVEKKLVLAQCCTADLAYSIIKDEALGKDVCDNRWSKLKYAIKAIDALLCYSPIGSTIEEATGASALFRLTAISSGATITITIKDGVTTLATYNYTTASTDVPTALRALYIAINTGFATNNKFAAYQSLGRNGFYDANAILLTAIDSLGATANAYTLEVGIAGGTATYTIDSTFKYGKDAVTETYNHFTDAQVDIILEKIDNLCGCSCDKSDSEILDDTIDPVFS